MLGPVAQDGVERLESPVVERGSPEAASVIWNWRVESEPQPSNESTSNRLRGSLQALAGGVVGTGIFFFVSDRFAYFIWGVAAVILLSALFSPGGLYALIDRTFLSLGNLLGQALTWILLPLVFYGFFVPFGRLLRRGSRDSMKRFYELEADTYWTEEEPSRSGSDERRHQY